jgi:hypothetical protein
MLADAVWQRNIVRELEEEFRRFGVSPDEGEAEIQQRLAGRASRASLPLPAVA